MTRKCHVRFGGGAWEQERCYLACVLPYAPLAHPLSHLLRIEAYQAHEGLITAPQRRQGRPALDPKQGVQAIEQAIWDERHHLALDRRALDVAQPVDHSELLQAVEEVIQQRAFVQPVDPVDDLLAVQAPGHPRIIPASRLPTQAFCQVLCNFFLGLFHGPPPSVVCSLAIRENGP